MTYIDFISTVHKSTKRDYLGRVNDKQFPKAKAAKLAKKWSYDYWDGDRRINYGGYNYIEGRWTPVAKAFIENYKLNNSSKILDVGCGKGFLLFEISKLLPGAEIYGIDISDYAIKNSKNEIKNNLVIGNATHLPWENNFFDFVFSINTLHNLQIFDLDTSLREIERVSNKHKYICVESYRNDEEKVNLIYWQVTCESFFSVDAWQWIFQKAEYTGDHSFIFFE